jgi:hypothetical protein
LDLPRYERNPTLSSARYSAAVRICVVSSIELADFIVRRLDMPSSASGAVQELSEKLIACCQLVPAAGNYIILGGSLARGEAIFREVEGRWQLVSDIDLLLVHESTLPMISSAEFVDHFAEDLPTLTIMTVSAEEYVRLETNIGYSFKNEGVPLNTATLPVHSPITPTTRDAFEVLLHSIICYFEERFIERWASGDGRPSFHYELSRICTKALRAVAMLDGYQSSRDALAAGSLAGALIRSEVEWQETQVSELDPGRIWEIFRLATERFDADYGAERLDAVSETSFERSLSGQIIKRHHRVASLLVREILRRAGSFHTDPDFIKKARDDAWTAIVSSGQVRPIKTPEEYFARQAGAFRENLLAMKVESTPQIFIVRTDKLI